MAQQQSSRLQRLLTLLDTGSTQATRFTAAKQIGEIAKSHPQDLSSLLSKVSQYLRSKRWDTRVAAARAIGAIAENVKHASLTDLKSCLEMRISESGLSASVDDVVAWSRCYPKLAASTSFKSFDLNKVLEFGALLASGGQEYDIANDNSKSAKDRLARQKQNLRRRLGLDMCEQFMDVNDMIRDEDLVTRYHPPGNGVAPQYFSTHSMNNFRQFVSNMVPTVKSRRPSARELNLLKRKAKINYKDQSKGWLKEGNSEVQPQEQDLISPKGPYSDIFNSNKQFTDTVSDEDSFDSDGDGVWPFQSFVEQLLLDMFDPVWEVRHGCVMALREILTHQGASAGVLVPDLNCSGTLVPNLKDNVEENKAKRERGIDLNMQIISDEPGPALKRPKFEDLSPELMDAVISSGEDDNLHVHIKVEDTGWSLPTGQANGEVSISSVKGEVEPESNLSGTWNLNYDGAESKVYSEEKGSSEKMDILKVIPENPELMNLVKLARHSWLTNSEFLQDCAIRFLCVLSLDRFGDYVSDQVVAPVRETCAQALGAVLKYMDPILVHETLNILLQMQIRVGNPPWKSFGYQILGSCAAGDAS